MAYFVSCKVISKTSDSALLSNVLLRKTHPIIWCANPPEIYKKFNTTFLISFSEIPDELLEDENVKNYFFIED